MSYVRKLAVIPVAGFATIVLSATPALAAPAITVSPATGVTNGQTVTIKGTGFTPSASIIAVQCSAPADQASCDLSNLSPTQSDATGAFTVTLKVKTGAVGNGTCAAGGTCYVAAANPSNTTDAGVASYKIAAASAPTTTTKTPTTTTKTPTTTKTTTKTTTGSGAAAPAVSAGSGGLAGENGVPTGVLVLAVAGVATLATGSYRLARR